MTVPTNNEEREALLQTFRDYGRRPITSENILKGGDEELADFLIAAGFRRPPVSGDNAELIAKIDRVEPTWPRGMYGCPQDMYGATVIVPLLKEITAALSASQPREVEVTDDMVERAMSAFSALDDDEAYLRLPGAESERFLVKAILVAALGGGDSAE